MKDLEWDPRKNEWIIRERGISFEVIAHQIAAGHVLADLGHPNRKKYPDQRILVVELGGVAVVVPYIEDGERIFLITAYPSREATQHYIKGRRS